MVINYLLSLIILVVGFILGFSLNSFFPNKLFAPAQTVPQTAEVTLPADATRIQACADNRGALYVRPSDIPGVSHQSAVGPLFMVNNGKVVGLEFMLNKEQLLNGVVFKYLSGLGMKVDHVNIGLLPHGHAGLSIPHYHVDIYNISRSEEEAIICQPTVSP